MILSVSCSVYKYVPPDNYLLDKVTIEVEENGLESTAQYKGMSYQTPNTKWFGLLRVPLAVYSLSSRKVDETGRNSLIRRIGEEPVLLDTMLCRASADNILKAMVNKGYLNADVKYTVLFSNRPKAEVNYILKPENQYVVSDYNVIVPDVSIDS